MAAYDAGSVTVGTSAVAITTLAASATTTLIRNAGQADIFISGSSGVTPSTGYLVKAGETFSLATTTAITVYGVSNQTGVVVYWLRSI